MMPCVLLLVPQAMEARRGQAPGGAPPAAAGEPPLQIAVRHLPLEACVLEPGTFVMAAHSAAAQLARAGGVAAGFGAADRRSQVRTSLAVLLLECRCRKLSQDEGKVRWGGGKGRTVPPHVTRDTY